MSPLVVEVQRGRDPRKRRTWPLYLAALHARLECPTCLVVVASDDAIAAWAATPIQSLQPGLSFAPLVLGPAQIPVVGVEQAAAHPWLAVLSAVAHGSGPYGLAIAVAAISALATLPDARATVGYDLIYASLDAAGRRALEDQMQPHKYEYQSDFARRYFGEGREKGLAEGRVEVLHGVLQTLAIQRLGELTVAQVARIAACREPAVLARAVGEMGAAVSASRPRTCWLRSTRSATGAVNQKRPAKARPTSRSVTTGATWTVRSAGAVK